MVVQRFFIALLGVSIGFAFHPNGSYRIGGPAQGLLIRDSESFGLRFRGAEGTLKVPIGPRKFSLETESAMR